MAISTRDGEKTPLTPASVGHLQKPSSDFKRNADRDLSIQSLDLAKYV